MPVYLLHGFRWPRPLVRIHIILQNLDDAAAEWLVAPNTSAVLLDNFHRLYPDAMGYLPGLRFVEQYDPNDTSANATSQPYAYVADMVQEIKLGVDIDDIRGKGVEQNRWAGMMELRDKLAPEEKVAWYVVVCGDEERTAPQVLGRMEMAPTNGLYSGSESEGRQIDHHHNSDFENKKEDKPLPDKPRGLSKLFGSGKLRRRKSRPNLILDQTEKVEDPESIPVPPIPQSAISPKPPQIPLDLSWPLQPPPAVFTNTNIPARGRSPGIVTPESPRRLRKSYTEPSMPPNIPSTSSTDQRSSDSPSRPADNASIAVSGSNSIQRSISPSVVGRRNSAVPPSRRPPTPPPDDPEDDAEDYMSATPPDIPRTASPSRRLRARNSTRSSVSLTRGGERTSKRLSRRFSLQATKAPPTSNPPPMPSSPPAQSAQPAQPMHPPPPPPPASGEAEEVAQEDEFEDVITMSPVKCAPIQKLRKPRSLYSNMGSSSAASLHAPIPGRMSINGDHFSVLSAPVAPHSSAASRTSNKKYFGESVNQFDLIANNIENAFTSMR